MPESVGGESVVTYGRRWPPFGAFYFFNG